MNSDLVPTPRVDKNGRTVTRHMKPSGNPQKRPTLPPVASPALQKMSNVELAAKSMEIIRANLNGMLSSELYPDNSRDHLELVYPNGRHNFVMNQPHTSIHQSGTTSAPTGYSLPNILV